MSRELDLWKGNFGDEYTERNEMTDETLAQRVNLFSSIFSAPTADPYSAVSDRIKILEVGANIGINLAAITRVMHRNFSLHALEPNDKARAKIIHNVAGVNIVSGEAASIGADSASFELVFTSGVLIHMDDVYLKHAMDEIYRVSKKWILCIEYFSPETVVKKYRDIEDFIYLRDYGSIWLNNYPLRCVGYNFCWKRMTGLDNVTWWLFEKVH